MFVKNFSFPFLFLSSFKKINPSTVKFHLIYVKIIRNISEKLVLLFANSNFSKNI